jgi:two-component SAPR family response regulator
LKTTILYLDDEQDLVDIFAETFSSDEIHVVTFTEPESAVEFIQNNHVDLAFFDYLLVGTTGVEIAREHELKIPIVFITGQVDFVVDRPNFQVLGKPFDPGEIFDIIDQYRDTQNIVHAEEE